MARVQVPNAAHSTSILLEPFLEQLAFLQPLAAQLHPVSAPSRVLGTGHESLV